MTTLRGLAFATALVFAVGCGDDGPVQTQTRGGDPNHGKAKADKEESAGPANDKGAQKVPAWESIRPHFLGGEGVSGSGAVNGPVQTLRDPFEPLLVKWVPRVEVEEEEPEPPEGTEPDGGTIENEGVAVEPPGETQKFKVQDYRVLMIRWGTSLDKAVVVDPEGMEFVVTRDMKIGNNNGRVVDITQFKVIVKEDSRDEPIELSILPELRPLGQDLEQTTERLFKNQSSE